MFGEKFIRLLKREDPDLKVFEENLSPDKYVISREEERGILFRTAVYALRIRQTDGTKIEVFDGRFRNSTGLKRAYGAKLREQLEASKASQD